MNHEIITEIVRNSRIALYLRENLIYDIEIDNPRYPLYEGLTFKANINKIDKKQGFTIFKPDDFEIEVIVRNTELNNAQSYLLKITKEARRDKLAEAIIVSYTKATDHHLNAAERLKSRYDAEITEQDEIIDMRGCWEQIQELQSDVVFLPSNKGSIIIEHTNALIAIDVNQGSSNSILNVNLTATKKIARHIKIRRLNGLILIDFIRMKGAKQKDDLIASLESEFKKLDLEATVHGFTRTGLMEVTLSKQKTPLFMLLNDFLV